MLLNPLKMLPVSQAARKAVIFGFAATRRAIGGDVCPCCRSTCGRIIKRFRLVLAAKQCGECGLTYRLPQKIVPRFYEEMYHAYSEWWSEYKSGQFKEYAKQVFRESHWDYYDKLSMITAVRPLKGRLLDFGGGSGLLARECKQLGFDAEVFELCTQLRGISNALLGLVTHNDLNTLLSTNEKDFDVVILHHVLEHIDDLPSAFQGFNRLLRDDGLFVLFVPNRLGKRYRGDPAATLDSVHVSAFDAEFFKNNMHRFGLDCVTFTTPYAFRASGTYAEETRCALGTELAVFAWKTGSPTPEPLKQWPYSLPDLGDSWRAQGYC